ncbi:hypothetical protein Q3G72_034049 [Acer saccharum]|nr:hypothetical protein Q3G72_034049 [Acer saccharum]
MEEVILKSKYFKAQKAKDKEENEQLMEELDKTFSSLVQSEALLSLTEPGKMNALKALVNKDIPNERLINDGKKPETFKQEQPDSYDKLVKEMALDMRARPSDRTKTAEEIAQDERERLERLENAVNHPNRGKNKNTQPQETEQADKRNKEQNTKAKKA